MGAPALAGSFQHKVPFHFTGTACSISYEQQHSLGAGTQDDHVGVDPREQGDEGLHHAEVDNGADDDEGNEGIYEETVLEARPTDVEGQVAGAAWLDHADEGCDEGGHEGVDELLEGSTHDHGHGQVHDIAAQEELLEACRQQDVGKRDSGWAMIWRCGTPNNSARPTHEVLPSRQLHLVGWGQDLPKPHATSAESEWRLLLQRAGTTHSIHDEWVFQRCVEPHRPAVVVYEGWAA